MVLVPEVVDAVGPDVPVLAAGGIAHRPPDGRRARARRAGRVDRFDLADGRRGDTSPLVIEKLLAATSRDTVRSRAMTGKPARQLRTEWTDAFDDPEDAPGHAADAVAGHRLQPRRRGASRAWTTSELTGFPVGQIVGRVEPRCAPRKDVIFDIVEEWIDTTQRLAGMLDDDA